MGKDRKIDTFVVKHNSLIEGRYKLSLPQMRMFLLMIAKVRREDDITKPYRIYLSDLIKLEEQDKYISLKNEYNTCFKITDELQIQLIKLKEDGIVKSVHLVGPVFYHENKGYFDYWIHEDIKDLLLNLKTRFTCYDIRNILPAKSVYTIRVYELLKQFEGLKERNIKLDDLKLWLGIDSKYKLYGDIKRHILKVSQKELKKYSDIYFEFKEIKDGKKVEGIHFEIKKQKQKRLFDTEENAKNDSQYLTFEQVEAQQKALDEQGPMPYSEWAKV